MSQELYHYYFYGCRLVSSWPLPSLPLWPAAQESCAKEIYLQPGQLPQQLEEPLWTTPFLQVGQDRSFLFQLKAVGRFWSQKGETILFEPAVGVEAFEIDTIFSSTIASLILHQLGVLPLHLSAVLWKGRAIAFAGRSTCGKSVLAAALVQRGAVLLADDLCVQDANQKRPHLFTASTRIRLAKDSLDHLQIPREQRLETRREHIRFAVEMPSAEPQSWPLSALFLLGESRVKPKIDCKRRLGMESFLLPEIVVPQYRAGRLFGSKVKEFQGLSQLASHTPIYNLNRGTSFKSLEECCELVMKVSEEAKG